MNRRDTIKLLAGAAAFSLTPAEVRHAAEFAARARSTGRGYEPKFFTPHEWETVRVLVDVVIPRDARSGSATEAGVPEFMDFVMTDQPGRQGPMRGGLAWLDTESRQRFGRTFVECADAQRAAVLDDIAWPDKAKPGYSHGVAFFNAFRDLTASGFWSSKMGVQDLQYLGNAVVLEWKGCPDEQMKKLGVTYAIGR
jgi:gluconate 2-dehydrogenase gamma chain